MNPHSSHRSTRQRYVQCEGWRRGRTRYRSVDARRKRATRGDDMHPAYTDDEEQLRKQLRDYYDGLLDDDTRRELRHAEGIGPVMRRVVRQMGADGWLGIGWPTKYGGPGGGPGDQFIFFDQAMRAGGPAPAPTWRRCAPGRSATATTTWSPARRCGRASPATPTTAGWRSAPAKTTVATAASRS